MSDPRSILPSARKVPATAIAPRQRRSLATLHRLLDAADDLLNERNFDDITVADVVARAGSSVGSFYARFSTKEALLSALLERYDQQVNEDISELSESDTWMKLDLEGRSRMFVQRVVHGCRRRRGLLRLRLRRRMTPGESVLADDKERGAKLASRFHQLFLPVADEIMHEDKDQALAFALRVVDSVASSAIVCDTGSNSFGIMPDEELAERLVAVFVAYLRGFRMPEAV